MTLRARIALVSLAAFALLAPPASAAVPFADITTPAGPLTRVVVGNELSCQVAYAGDSAFELFPSTATPGSCGTFIATGGTLYAPDFVNHEGSATAGLGDYTAFTAVSQSGVTGSGSGSDPKRVVTVATAGSLEITETDSYVAGQEAYRTDVVVKNTGGAAATGVIYRAGDCYLQERDTGFGFVDTAVNAAGCALNANNSPPARIEQWYPLTAGARYIEDSYNAVWIAVQSKAPFPNTCQCAAGVDNAAGISWEFNVAPGASATFSHLTVFSPRGVAGPPPPPSGPTGPQTGPTGDNAQIFGRNGIVNAPSNRRCVSRRNFKIRLRNPIGTQIVAAVVRVNGNRVATKRGVRTTAKVDLRGLPKGRYTVSITILLDNDRTIRGKRKYRTCGKVRRRGRTPRV